MRNKIITFTLFLALGLNTAPLYADSANSGYSYWDIAKGLVIGGASLGLLYLGMNVFDRYSQAKEQARIQHMMRLEQERRDKIKQEQDDYAAETRMFAKTHLITPYCIGQRDALAAHITKANETYTAREGSKDDSQAVVDLITDFTGDKVRANGSATTNNFDVILSAEDERAANLRRTQGLLKGKEYFYAKPINFYCLGVERTTNVLLHAIVDENNQQVEYYQGQRLQ